MTDHEQAGRHRPAPLGAVPDATAGGIAETEGSPRPEDGSEQPSTRSFSAARGTGPRRVIGTVLTFITFVVLVMLSWELIKWIGGDPWRYDDFLGTGIAIDHRPPLRFALASDRQLPHIWDIAGALAAPVQRNQEQTLAGFLAEAALYTWFEAAIGFAVGAAIGILLASLFIQSRALERAFVPYVVASQTIPIVALAPLIVVGFGRGLTAVVIIATYLTFFPVTIATMRGLTSPDPRAVELMRSYAASRWAIYRKVRLPASVPYLFTALKVAATASIVGAIIGEGPGGVPEGLGRAIINFNQQYSSGPEKLWGTILVAGLTGVAFYAIVQLVETIALRSRRRAAS